LPETHKIKIKRGQTANNKCWRKRCLNVQNENVVALVAVASYQKIGGVREQDRDRTERIFVAFQTIKVVSWKDAETEAEPKEAEQIRA